MLNGKNPEKIVSSIKKSNKNMFVRTEENKMCFLPFFFSSFQGFGFKFGQLAKLQIFQSNRISKLSKDKTLRQKTAFKWLERREKNYKSGI